MPVFTDKKLKRLLQSGVLTFLLAMVPLLSGQLSAQTAVTGWEYWFDNGLDKRIFTTLATNQTETIESHIDVSSLADGLHILNYRFRDENGLWSLTGRKPFVKRGYGESFPSFVKSELWIDNRPVASFSQEIYSVDNYSFESLEEVAALTDGLHRISFRVMDGAGRWSVPLVSLFRKYSVPPGEADLRRFQIWFDGDIGLQPWTTALSPNLNVEMNAEISFLSDGLHRIYFRAGDIYGRWSGVYSALFKKQTTVENGTEIVAYQYWIDNIEGGTTEVSTSNPADMLVIDQEINFSPYSPGEYNFYIRFLDNSGRWSVPVADTLERLSFLKALFDNDVTEGCVELEVTFTNNSTDASAFRWYFGDNSISEEANPSHTYLTPGDYEVALVAYDVDAGLKDSVFITNAVTVNPLPVVSLGEDINDAPQGIPIVLDPGSFISYLWNDNSTDPTLTVTGSGDYSVQVTDNNGCVNSDVITISFATFVGRVEERLSARIWPNPLPGAILKVEIPGGEAGDTEIRVLNSNGKIMISRLFPAGSGDVIDLDLSELENGNYILLFRNGEQYGTAKIMVTR